ncbi:hypothetical protein ABBQ32_002160 [Trebouxia sp. C0010 RCD-2024]
MDSHHGNKDVTWKTQSIRRAEVLPTHPPNSAAARLGGHASTSGPSTNLLHRREWCSVAQVLRNQQQALQSTLNTPWESFRDGRQVHAEMAQQAVDRRLLASALAARTSKIKGTIQSIQNKLIKPESGPEFVQSLAATLDAGEQQITDLKQEQRHKYDALTKEEQYLSRELELMLDRLESPAWNLAHQSEQAPLAQPPVARLPAAYHPKQGGGLLPEVEAFDDFHEQHGPTGGWHPDDHSEFERILKVCKGDYSHATLMCYDQMIGFKRSDIIAHARWHAEHQELYVRKRIALAEWRNQKEAEKAAIALQASVDPPSARQAQHQRQHHQEQSRMSRQAVQPSCTSHLEPSPRASAFCRELRRQSLAEWRAAREQEERELTIQLAEQQELQKQTELAVQAERQAANKHKLEEYHHLKAQQDAQAAAQAALASDQPVSRLDFEQLHRIKQRNHELMQRKKETTAAKQHEEEERLSRLHAIQEQVSAKVNAKVQKDPQRLLKVTAAAQQRLAAEQEDSHSSKPSGFIRHISGKGVPAWRQPLRGMQV